METAETLKLGMAAGPPVLDVQELQKLLEMATRPSVKSILENQIVAKTAVLQKVEQEQKQKAAAEAAAAAATADATTADADSAAQGAISKNVNYKYISSFSWDQSDATVSIYLTDSMSGVGLLDKSNIQCSISEKEVDLTITGLEGKNYRFRRSNLHSSVDVSASHHRVKRDMIVITLKKAEKGHWDALEAKPKPKLPDTDPTDPSAGLMSMMKNMYEEGDPEMKRTIAKAWTESMEKKGGAGAM